MALVRARTWPPFLESNVPTIRSARLAQWNLLKVHCNETNRQPMFYEKLRKLHNYHKIHKPFPFTNPVSTTYLTPGIVIDVSAMFVARITFRFPRGAEMNTFIWCCDGKAANMGHTRSSGHSVNRKKQHIIPLNRRSPTISKNPLLLYRKYNKLDFKVKDLSIIFVMNLLRLYWGKLVWARSFRFSKAKEI